jgi:hypothetical protein
MNPYSLLVKGKIKSPVKEYDGTDRHSEDYALQDALRERYNIGPGQNQRNMRPKEFVNMVRADLGTGPYKLNFSPKAEILESPHQITFGDYNPEERHLRLNKDYRDVFGEATLFHELAHNADQIANPWFEASNNYRTPLTLAEREAYGLPPNDHFADLTGPNPDWMMAQSLDAQKNIEQGFDPDPQVVANMPWLKKVVPLSSNMLANPWRDKIEKSPLSYTPEAWNQSFTPLWHPPRQLPDQRERR